uniref:Chorismate mutase n=1 Tax=Coccolithus braarudii TaxID=221442 RepID=A0A7S0Q0Z0_9EUKA|mmetsp:Transcript_21548/g.46375  ORF Transcript_21548/g.46375 Transcript_21548/m.46375 type:complete len:205 (+) Transcript_21548:27-641(+)
MVLFARLVMLVAGAAALRTPPTPPTSAVAQSRRTVVTTGCAIALARSFPTPPAFAGNAAIKEQLAEKVAANREAERVAALPITKLRALRGRLAAAPSLIEEGNWNALRNVVRAMQGTSDLASAATSTDTKPLTKRLNGKLFVVDNFAYSQELAFTGVLSGYCAPGVVPRDEPGSCKVRPFSTAEPLAALKEALATFDEILAQCS